ncbi:MAG: histidinol-phosphate transaminase [Bacillus sp. (in: firmicutes)]
MKWKTNVLSIKAYQPGRTIDEVKRQFGLDSIVKLASNENPYGYSKAVDELLKSRIGHFELYPDGAAVQLKHALSVHHNVPAEQIILGNGSDEIISIISRSILRPGLNTVMAKPTFSQYKHNALVEDAEIREVDLVNGKHDLEAMLQAIDENTAIVWLCTPNNPSGVHIPEKELLSFLDQVDSNVLVVLDEAYREYVVADDYPESLNFLGAYPNIILLRTFSKIYGLASFRVGYGISSKEIIAKLDPVREPFNVNAVGQAVAITALQDQDFIVQCRQKNRKGLEQYYAFCEEEQLNYYPSQANFILIDLGRDGDEVFQHLMSKGYIVRSGKALGFPTCIRITVGSEEQNIGMIDELCQLMHAGAKVQK